MKKLILILVLISSSLCAATRPSFLDLKDLPVVNAREYGVKPGVDSAPGFAALASYVESLGGNCKVLIPPGDYTITPGGAATPAGRADFWKCFSLTDCDNVFIEAHGVTISSSINMGAVGVNGRSMDVFFFENCNNVVITGCKVRVMVTSSRNPADTVVPELTSIVQIKTDDSESCGNFVFDMCDFSISNSTNGNGSTASGKEGYEFFNILINSKTLVYPLKNITIRNCIFSEVQGMAIHATYVDGLVISNNVFDECGGPLPTIRHTVGCSNVLIVNNRFTMTNQPGQDPFGHSYPISFVGKTFSVSDPESTNIVISNNYIRTLGGHGVAVNGAESVKINGNVFYSSASDVATYTAATIALPRSPAGEENQQVSITDNTFIGAKTSAITTYAGSITDLLVANNTFNECLYSITTANSSPQKIIFNNNTIKRGVSYQLYFTAIATSSPDVNIIGNVFEDNAERCILVGGSDPGIYNISNNIFERNNVLASDTAAAANIVLASGFAGGTITSNIISDAKGSGVYAAVTTGNGLVVSGNRVVGAGREAIVFAGSQMVFTGNLLLNNNQQSLPGISNVLIATGSNNVSVIGNTIKDAEGNCEYGIWMASCSTSLVHSNLLYDATKVSGTKLATGTAGVSDVNNIY